MEVLEGFILASLLDGHMQVVKSWIVSSSLFELESFIFALAIDVLKGFIFALLLEIISGEKKMAKLDSHTIDI